MNARQDSLLTARTLLTRTSTKRRTILQSKLDLAGRQTIFCY